METSGMARRCMGDPADVDQHLRLLVGQTAEPLYLLAGICDPCESRLPASSSRLVSQGKARQVIR